MATNHEPLKLNIGSGPEPKPGWINSDLHDFGGLVDLKADIRRLPFNSEVFTQILAESVLEHLNDPRPALAELARLLHPSGQIEIRVPALGTNAAHLDPTHRYLADLKHWQELMLEHFEWVKVRSIGVRWRQSRSLVLVQRLLISIMGWHDLAQCWILIGRMPRKQPVRIIPSRWWLDQPQNSAIAAATSDANRPT